MAAVDYDRLAATTDCSYTTHSIESDMHDIDDLADRQDRLYERHKEYLGVQARNAVCIVGHREYLSTFSGQVTWATLLNLVVRLYKGIRRIRISLDSDLERLPRVFFPNDHRLLRDA